MAQSAPADPFTLALLVGRRCARVNRTGEYGAPMNRFFTSWKFTYALAFALLVGMFALRADDPSPLKILRNKTFDVMQRVWPREPPPEGYPINVRIIDLDD